uniref:Uncharacterized protein n=1 Tax=Aegilops tauschii subsp. strangulata TaxID=200361 RepID=A0A453IVL1_AEGTS
HEIATFFQLCHQKAVYSAIGRYSFGENKFISDAALRQLKGKPHSFNEPFKGSKPTYTSRGISYFQELFTANKNKPRDITSILVANKSKIIRFLNAFTLEKGVSLALTDAEDRVFESDKAQVLADVMAMKL